MTDRIKDLFKTSVGKYVSPQKIELLLGQDSFIEQVITIGDNRKYITALIVPVMARLKEEATKFNLSINQTKNWSGYRKSMNSYDRESKVFRVNCLLTRRSHGLHYFMNHFRLRT